MLAHQLLIGSSHFWTTPRGNSSFGMVEQNLNSTFDKVFSQTWNIAMANWCTGHEWPIFGMELPLNDVFFISVNHIGKIFNLNANSKKRMSGFLLFQTRSIYRCSASIDQNLPIFIHSMVQDLKAKWLSLQTWVITLAITSNWIVGSFRRVRMCF